VTISPPVPGTQRAPTGEDRWSTCPRCRNAVYTPRLARNLDVCPECGYHHRIGSRQRLAQLVDAGTWRPAPHPVPPADPLGFVDTRPYPSRLTDARRRTGLDEAIQCGRAAIGGHPAVVAVMDFGFLGGSMGTAVGEAVTRAVECAADTRTPLVLVVASGGARMQEGCLSLMQMAKTNQALCELRRRGVPSVCVLTDPTFGGVTASFATLADILVAERGSLIGFAGPRVIEAATRRVLPAGFQTAEYLHGKGMVDRVEPREAIKPLLIRLLSGTRRNCGPPARRGRPYGWPATSTDRPPWTICGRSARTSSSCTATVPTATIPPSSVASPRSPAGG
jgi:acetyl-CoA carboxylase carboxyl transferase beta subunit